MPALKAHIAALALALVMAGAAGGPSPATAQESATGGRLEQVEKSLEKSRREGQALSDIASRLARQISDLRKERVKAARTALTISQNGWVVQPSVGAGGTCALVSVPCLP